MIALLLGFLSSPTVLAVLAVIVGLVGAFFGGNVRGSRRERDKQAAERLRAREVADEVDNDIGALSPEQQRERLRKWAK